MLFSNTTWQGRTCRFLSAQTFSLFGSSLAQYAIIWHLTLSTTSGKMLTLSTLCGFLPQICISLFAGVWLDRYDRKKLSLLSDGIIALATLALAVALWRGQESYWLLFAVLAVRSAGTGVQTPAVNALLPQLVPQEQLLRVNGISSALNSMMMLLSPAAGGALLAAFPLEAALLVDVVTAILGMGLTATVPIPPRVPSGDRPVSALLQLRQGFSYLRQTPVVRRLLVFQAVVLFLISPSAFLTPLLVARSFGGETWYLAASELTYSLGMVLGGLVIASWGGFKNRLRTTLLAGGLYGLLMLGLGLAPAFWVYLLCNGLIGITSPCYNAPLTATLQQRVPAEMQGRVFSLMQLSTSCALPLGMALFGPLADSASVERLLLLCGGAVVLVCVVVSRSGALDESPGRPFDCT